MLRLQTSFQLLGERKKLYLFGGMFLLFLVLLNFHLWQDWRHGYEEIKETCDRSSAATWFEVRLKFGRKWSINEAVIRIETWFDNTETRVLFFSPWSLVPCAPRGVRKLLWRIFTLWDAMAWCDRGVQTLLAIAGAFAAFSLMTIAIGTDYWLYSRAYICNATNVTTDETQMQTKKVKGDMTHSGLWRICCIEGK